MGKEAAGLSEAALELEKELTPEPEAGAGGAADDKAGKGAAGEAGAGKGAAADDDPEIDLSAHGFGKVKKSQLKQWQEGGMKEDDYRKKTEELSGREAQIKELVELSDYLAKNPKKLKSVLAILDASDEVVEAGKPGGEGTTKAEIETQQAQIKAVLDKLDPEDPMSAIFKAMYADLQETKKMLKGFQTDREKMQQQEQQDQLTQQKQVFQDQVKYAEGLLTKTFTELEKELKFEGDEEKSLFKEVVISQLKKNNLDGFKSEEEFVKAVKDTGAVVFKKIRAIAEANLKKHLEGKGKPKLPGQGASGAGASDKPMTMENLQENIEVALTEASAGNQ